MKGQLLDQGFKETAILLICDSKEVCHRNSKPVGPIKDLFYGSEHSQTKTFKAHAIEVRQYIRCFVIS